MTTPPIPRRGPFILAVVASLIFGSPSRAAAARYVITEHGALGDGTTVNTKALQATIDACSAAGGGVLVVPQGTYLSGALFFKSGVSLEIEKGGVLKSTTVQADFPPVYTNWEGIERYWTAGFLNFIGTSNVVVSGEGTIDGSGLSWPGAAGRRAPGSRGPQGGGKDGKAAPGKRPPPQPEVPPSPLPKPEDVYPSPLPTVASISLAPDPAHLPIVNAAGIYLPGGGGSRLSPPRAVIFQNCSNVRISGVHLKNQARWGYVFINCRDVVAENLTQNIDSYIPSSDGMDVCSCQNVRISGCSFDCTDDDISLKAGKDADGLRLNRPCENVTISDCIFGSGAGVALGSEVSGSIRHVLVERCKFTGSSSAARIKSQPSRGGVVEDVVYRDIQMSDVGRAIEIDVEWRMVPPLAPPAAVLTAVRNVRLINFTGTARTVGIVRGFKQSPIEGVVFENCAFSAQRGLILTNEKDTDLKGLKATVAEGEVVTRQEATSQL